MSSGVIIEPKVINPMDNLEQRAAELRAEIDELKAALVAATDEDTRFGLHARVDRCIRESLALIEQRLQNYYAQNAEPLREREVGGDSEM
jgi:hypothetical protein